MGVYAVTGGSSGIGAAVVELLKKDGNEVINIDLKTEISVRISQLSRADRQPSMVYTKNVLTVLTESYAMPVFREAVATMSL